MHQNVTHHIIIIQIILIFSTYKVQQNVAPIKFLANFSNRL